MPLITDPTPRGQQTYGPFKPKSNLNDAKEPRYGVVWAAVEGRSDSRFPSLSEVTGIGQPVGTQGRHRLQFEEAKFNGKPNDIKVGGLTLRECRAPIEEIREADRIAASESNERLMQFHPQAQRGGVKNVEFNTTVEDTSKHIPDTQNTPV